MIVVTGGPGWESESRRPQTLAALRQRAADTLLVSVCTGGMILGASGVLDGKRATTKREVVPPEVPPIRRMRELHPLIDVREASLVDEDRVITGRRRVALHRRDAASPEEALRCRSGRRNRPHPGISTRMVGKSRTIPAARSRKLGKRAAPAKRPSDGCAADRGRAPAGPAGYPPCVPGWASRRTVLAAKAGFTKGYLSKIENSKVIPPIGTLVKIAQVLDTDLADLFEAAPAQAANDAVSIVRSWERETAIRGGSSFGYDYVALAHKRHHKQMEPFVMVFPSRVDKDIRFEHQGEEFMFILSGKVEFEATIEGRNKTWILSPGDSAYFDAEIPHRGRSLRGESRALVVIYRSKDPV